MSVSYEIAITRRDGDVARATIEWDGYVLLHELLTDIMAQAAQYGWLADWPEMPDPKLLKPE